MKKAFFTVILTLLFLSGCATTRSQLLKIDSTPPDALISVHDGKEPAAGNIRKVAGTTPLERNFDFPSDGKGLWLEIEKRGYAPQRVEATPESRALTVQLERVRDKNGEPVKEYAFPPVKRLLFAIPDFTVVKRGFSSEEVSKEESGAAKTALTKGIQAFFAGRYETVPIADLPDGGQLLKPAWRDAKAAMELVDPIRLKYLSTPPYLETRSAREAVRQLGLHFGAEALLVLAGRQNLETAGMVMGKVGMAVAGTAASYGNAFGRAFSRGESLFVYTVYTPAFSQGTLVQAAVIECTTGEILWLNRGIWGPLNFNEPDAANDLIKDLLTGLN